MILPYMQGVSRERDQRRPLLQLKSWWGFKHYLLSKHPPCHASLILTYTGTQVFKNQKHSCACKHAGWKSAVSTVCALVGGCQERLHLEFYACPNKNNGCGLSVLVQFNSHYRYSFLLQMLYQHIINLFCIANFMFHIVLSFVVIHIPDCSMDKSLRLTFI